MSESALTGLMAMIRRAAAALIVLTYGVYASASTNTQEEVREQFETSASADPGREIEAAIAVARRELQTASAILNSLVSSGDPAVDAYVRRMESILQAANALAPEQLHLAAGSLASELQGARSELAETCASVTQWLAVARATAPGVEDVRLPARFEFAEAAASLPLDFDDLVLRAHIAEYYDRNTEA